MPEDEVTGADDLRPDAISDEVVDSDSPEQSPTPAGRPPSRRDIISQKRTQQRRNRPYIIGGFLLFVAILAIPVYGYVQKFVLPPRQLAVQVNDATYTRGDVVDFVRFHQRLAVDQGNDFRIIDNVTGALETISENEIAYQRAPLLGITVTEGEVEGAIRETLGFRGMTASEAAVPAVAADIKEAFRQLLNRIQLSEKAYRDIVRKGLFREKARRELARKVPRIQPQVHVYALEFRRNTDPDIDRARRRLTRGEDVAQVALDLSQGLTVPRDRGEVGWIPEFAEESSLNDLFFGVDENGQRKLPVGKLSDGIWDADSKVYRYYYIKEIAEEREVDQKNLDKLSDRALGIWLEDQRVDIGNYKLILDSDIIEWITRQVRLARIAPTSTPVIVPGAAPDVNDVIQQYGG